MSKQHAEIDFATVLAASVHDMKNSLCLLLQSTEMLEQEAAALSTDARDELARLHYEASRVNSNLLQLLSLYRLQKDQLPLHVDEHFPSDILEEILLHNQSFSRYRHVDIQIESDENLAWYFDRELIIHVLNDVFVNALRYCRQRILVKVSVEQQQLVLAVHDDGPGFPDFMLQALQPDMLPPDLQRSHTGLGLYFARLIAAAHKNHGKHGTVQLRNNSELGGGVFQLQLP